MMIHTKDWHLEQAELLLERAEKFAEEFDMDWPGLKAQYETLMERANAHARIARAM